MGGDDSQKLLPWRGSYSSPGRKPPAQRFHTVTESTVESGDLPPPSPGQSGQGLRKCLGHSWKVQVGQFWQAPKVTRRARSETRFDAIIQGKSRMR